MWVGNSGEGGGSIRGTGDRKSGVSPYYCWHIDIVDVNRRHPLADEGVLVWVAVALARAILLKHSERHH